MIFELNAIDLPLSANVLGLLLACSLLNSRARARSCPRMLAERGSPKQIDSAEF